MYDETYYDQFANSRDFEGQMDENVHGISLSYLALPRIVRNEAGILIFADIGL